MIDRVLTTSGYRTAVLAQTRDDYGRCTRRWDWEENGAQVTSTYVEGPSLTETRQETAGSTATNGLGKGITREINLAPSDKKLTKPS